MLHWYCKATYNLGQFFFSLKRHTIWDEGSMMQLYMSKLGLCDKINNKDTLRLLVVTNNQP